MLRPEKYICIHNNKSVLKRHPNHVLPPRLPVLLGRLRNVRAVLALPLGPDDSLRCALVAIREPLSTFPVNVVATLVARLVLRACTRSVADVVPSRPPVVLAATTVDASLPSVDTPDWPAGRVTVRNPRNISETHLDCGRCVK
jgi:hypothetical protein